MMDYPQTLRLQWLAPGQLTFGWSYNRVSRVIPFGAGFLYFDAGHPTLISAEGEILWRNEEERAAGVGLGQAVVSSELLAYAGTDYDLKIIDAKGALRHAIDLGTCLESPLTVDANGLIFGGIGSYVCHLFCASVDGRLRWKRSVVHDAGLNHASVVSARGQLWVPTGAGLWCLESLTGEPVPLHPDADQMCCLSALLVIQEDILVVAASGPFRCALVRLDRQGRVIERRPLPDLSHAILLPLADGDVWVVGKTASNGAFELEAEDRVYALRMTASGQQLAAIELPGHLVVDAAVAADGNLWVATYSDDASGDWGELYVLDRSGGLLASWVPDNPRCGFGAPVILTSHRAIVPTTLGLACLDLEQSR